MGKITIQSQCYRIKTGGFCRGIFVSRIFLQWTLGSAAESSVLCVDLGCKELVFKSFFFFLMDEGLKKEKEKVIICSPGTLHMGFLHYRSSYTFF